MAVNGDSGENTSGDSAAEFIGEDIVHQLIVVVDGHSTIDAVDINFAVNKGGVFVTCLLGKGECWVCNFKIESTVTFYVAVFVKINYSYITFKCFVGVLV